MPLPMHMPQWILLRRSEVVGLPVARFRHLQSRVLCRRPWKSDQQVLSCGAVARSIVGLKRVRNNSAYRQEFVPERAAGLGGYALQTLCSNGILVLKRRRGGSGRPKN